RGGLPVGAGDPCTTPGSLPYARASALAPLRSHTPAPPWPAVAALRRRRLVWLAPCACSRAISCGGLRAAGPPYTLARGGLLLGGGDPCTPPGSLRCARSSQLAPLRSHTPAPPWPAVAALRRRRLVWLARCACSRAAQISRSRQRGLDLLLRDVGAGVDCRGEQLLLVGLALLDDDVALLVEHPGDAVCFAQISAVLRECVAHLADGAVLVVGEHLDHDRDAAGPVSLVHDFLVR